MKLRKIALCSSIAFTFAITGVGLNYLMPVSAQKPANSKFMLSQAGSTKSVPCQEERLCY
ncbi:MAG: hypothetical protein KME29_33030 [Calothrix sp. FI2-JRJ7]|nr:hypothetical protein [Calothrix sp. FI2-JRJ7]